MGKQRCDMCRLLHGSGHFIEELLPWNGYEVCRICFDELTHWKEYDSWARGELRKVLGLRTFKIEQATSMRRREGYILCSFDILGVVNDVLRNHGIPLSAQLTGLGVKVAGLDFFVSYAGPDDRNRYLEVGFIGPMPRATVIQEDTPVIFWLPKDTQTLEKICLIM